MMKSQEVKKMIDKDVRKRLKRRARALVLFEGIEQAFISQRFSITFGTTAPNNRIVTVSGVDNPGHGNEFEQLVNNIFKPLLSSGLKAYKQKLIEIAEEE